MHTVYVTFSGTACAHRGWCCLFWEGPSPPHYIPSFFLTCLTPPEVCVCCLPIKGFQATEVTKPTTATKTALLLGGARRGLCESFLFISLLALIHLPWLLSRSSYQGCRENKKKRLTWKEKNGVSGDLLREKVQGWAQMLTKIPPFYHLPCTIHRHFIWIPKPGQVGVSKLPAQQLIESNSKNIPTTQLKNGQKTLIAISPNQMYR